MVLKYSFRQIFNITDIEDEVGKIYRDNYKPYFCLHCISGGWNKKNTYANTLWNSSFGFFNILISDDYSLKDVLNQGNERNNCLQLFESIKDLCSHLPDNTIDDFELILLSNEEWKSEYYYMNRTVQNALHTMLKKGKKQIILTGAPGTGKSYGALDYIKSHITGENDDSSEEKVKQYLEVVQFHSSYDYTDFIEGMRPVVIGYNGDVPITHYVRLDGIFKSFCRKAEKDKENTFYFVIDEINRADLSRVFGETMYCLEESNRGELHKIKTQYSNIPTYYNSIERDIFTIMEDDVFEDGFYIPNNVIIIGTMNDIDRSVDSFDFALRRRFRWVNIRAIDTMAVALLEEKLHNSESEDRNKIIDLVKEVCMRAAIMNARISDKQYMLGEEFQIGQSYFQDYDVDTKPEIYFEEQLRPILTEYVRGRRNTEAFINECKNAFIDMDYKNTYKSLPTEFKIKRMKLLDLVIGDETVKF